MTPDIKQQIVSEVLVLRVDPQNQQPLPLEIESSIRQTVELMNQEKDRNVVLNLAGIRYVNSTVFEVLVNRLKQLKSEGRQLRLCCLDPELADLMSVHHLDRLFAIDATEEAAIEAAGPR